MLDKLLTTLKIKINVADKLIPKIDEKVKLR